MNKIDNTLGAVVLCGGESRRMGTAKACLPFGTERMLQRVVRLVGGAVESVVVVAAPGQDLPPLPKAVRVVRDAIAYRGPLQGISAGFRALPDSVELAYVTATDVPFLHPGWVGVLVDRIGDHDLAIPYAEGYHHPLAALYRTATALPAIESLLYADRLRVLLLLEVLRTRLVAADELARVDPALVTLRNLNSPEDYRAAIEALGRNAGG